MSKVNEVTYNEQDYKEQQLASIWNFKFKNSMIHKAPYTKRWQVYMDAYSGDYFKNEKIPDYRSNMVSNYVFSIIETIRPLMLDNNPKFQAMPRQPEGMEFSNDLQEALMYEWDRERMNKKIYRELINTLVLGNAVFFIAWDRNAKNIKAIPVSPFNVFPDPLATSVEDSEYIIYADYFNVEQLKRMFPNKANKLYGSSINYSELVNNNDKNAMIDNQVLVLEIWTRDFEVNEHIDNKKKDKSVYPKGRVLTICPELGIVLSDKPNPYNDNGLPFEVLKDYDIPGKFWGEGEVAQLLSPQKHINDLNNAIIDNAKTTANMPWIVDKNAGIPIGGITARPGLVIRKNPGTEVKREQPPSMPGYVTQAIDVYKQDIEQISGVFNTLKGENTTGVYTAQGILALQEAGQVRIRLKIKLLEDSLSKIGQMWFSRMKQFWSEDKWIRVTKTDGSYDMKKFTNSVLEHDYDVKVVAGSTMPVNKSAMLDLMIRLAQTPMPDGQQLVDREAVVHYLPEEIRSGLLRRMSDGNQAIEELQMQMQQLAEQLQQVAQQSESNNEQVFDVIEEITSAIEKVNQQILQLKENHDKIEKDRAEQDKLNKIKEEAYNKGYQDAEELYKEDEVVDGLPEEEYLDDEGLPEEILAGLENMSDEELALIMQSNPELLDLLK